MVSMPYFKRQRRDGRLGHILFESAAAGETEAKSLPQVKTAQRTATTVEISAIKNTLYRRAFFGAMLGAVAGGAIITALAILIISLM